MSKDLSDKIVIVTKSGRRIGKDITIKLSKEGCKLMLVSRLKEQAYSDKKLA